MAPVTRRPVAPPPAALVGVNFGDDSFYSSGGNFDIPEGDYAVSYDTRMHTPTKQDGTVSGAPFLAVGLTAIPVKHDGEKWVHTGHDVQEQLLSMGKDAHMSFQPDPNTGKGLVAVPGGPKPTVGGKTNWALHRKSLIDCGLPPGTLTNDFSVLDGTIVHIQSQPEPEDRKAFGAKSATGDATEEENKKRGPRMIPIVTEIKEDGKPWEGTGGIPELVEAAAAPVPAKPGPKGVVRPPLKPVATPPARPAVTTAPAAVVTADEDTHNAALNGAAAVIEASIDPATGAQGVITKVLLRTGTFKNVKDTLGEEMCQAVMGAYFSNDAALGGLLAELGYMVKGVGPTANIVPKV